MLQVGRSLLLFVTTVVYHVCIFGRRVGIVGGNGILRGDLRLLAGRRVNKSGQVLFEDWAEVLR